MRAPSSLQPPSAAAGLLVRCAFVALTATAVACSDDAPIDPDHETGLPDAGGDTSDPDTSDPDTSDPDTSDPDTSVPQVTVTIVVEGDAPGALLAGGEPCDDGCVVELSEGATLELAATPHPYARVAWGDDECAGDDCSVTVDEDTELTVRFLLSHNVIFYTSETPAPGNYGGLAGSDARCARLAAAAGLHHEHWVALLATDGPCPGEEEGPCTLEDRLDGAQGFVNLDLEAVFNTLQQVRDDLVWFPVRKDDTGAERLRDTVATGAAASHDPAPDRTCADFTSLESNVAWGRPSTTRAMMLRQNSNIGCSAARSHYCVSVDYAAAVEPLTGEGRLAFLTDATWTPGGGLAGADALCQREACEAGLTGSGDCDESLGDERTFLALLDADELDAGSRFDAEGPDYYRVDGLRFVAAARLALPFRQLAPRTGLTVLADGTRLTGSLSAWSGVSNEHCESWTSTSGSARAGSPDQIADYNVDNTRPACNTAARLYCLEL